MNEEPRISLEELKSASEEIPAADMDLPTTDRELMMSFEELKRSNRKFHDLLISIDIGIILLDRSLRLNYLSSAARRLFNLASIDEHTFLSDIAKQFDLANLEADAKSVLSTLEPTEREVSLNGSDRYLLRIVPSLTAEGAIGGVLITFTDITRIKTPEAVPIEMLREEIEERKLTETNVRQLLRRLVDIQEEERKRIARNIHDQLGQELTALRIHLESLRTISSVDQEMDDQISKALKFANDLDRSVDFLTWELRPASLDHLGLAPALAELVKSWSDRFGISAEFQSTGTENLRLSPEAETNLYLFAREALHNIFKHAQATNVGLMFENRDGQVVLIIEDDGKGFDFESISTANSRGLGIVSMRERAALIGAEVEIESKPGEGTSVYVRLPLSSEHDASHRKAEG